MQSKHFCSFFDLLLWGKALKQKLLFCCELIYEVVSFFCFSRLESKVQMLESKQRGELEDMRQEKNRLQVSKPLHITIRDIFKFLKSNINMDFASCDICKPK